MEEKKIKYMLNEIRCYFLRRKQMKQYIQKVQSILNGSSIEEVEKRYPPITWDSINKKK